VSYTAAVDVWSLGVTVYDLLCSLPKYGERYRGGGTAWCEKVIEKIEVDLAARPDKLRQFLLDAMLTISPASRRSAQYCHCQALLLSNASHSHRETPDPALYVDKNGYANDEGQATVRYSIEDGTAGDPHTVVWRPSSLKVNFANSSTKTSEVARAGTPPGQALAAASRTSQKRPTAMLTSSSLGRRRYTKRRGVSSARVEPPLRLLDPETWIEDEQEQICDQDQCANTESSYAQGLPQSQSIAAWEQDRNATLNQPLEELTPPDLLGEDALLQATFARQVENNWKEQEATHATLLLQTLGQDPHPSNLFRSVIDSLVISTVLNSF